MAVVIMDGRVRVFWLTACANVNSPTVAELNAGTNITAYIVPDGLDIGNTTGRVRNSNVGSTTSTEKIGRRKPSISLTCYHDATTGSADPLWALMVYRNTGFLAIRRGIDTATAWATGQGGGGTTGAVEVYPSECAQDVPVKPAEDTSWDFTIDLAITDPPGYRSVVA